ncbi:MAG: FAD-binding oxidoreductase [Bacteroidota bacterium]
MEAPPQGFISARIERRLDVVNDLAVFWLRPEEPVTFLPGQYVTLAVEGATGRTVKRAYSIVSAPHEPLLELVIERVDEGALTPVLWNRQPGDVLWARKKIVGHFLLDAERLRHVMVCTVTGIAPFLSMIRAHLAALHQGEAVPDHRFLVLHGASHAPEFGPYLDELATLAAESDGRVVGVPTVSRPWANPDWAGETGRVEDVLRKYLDRLGWNRPDTAGYACGNPTMIETVKGMLRRAGLDDAHIHDEKYYTETLEPEAAPKPAPQLEPSPARRKPLLPGQMSLRAVSRPEDPAA